MADLSLVLGVGHGHNELLAYLLNQSHYTFNKTPLVWELYPGPLGCFIRHEDTWNTRHDKVYEDFYNSIRSGDNWNSITTQEHIIELRRRVQEMHITQGKLAQYLNCLNFNEAIKIANSLEIRTSTAIWNLPESKHRNHYAQMEFSTGAAKSVDYSSLEYSLHEVCKWLVKKDAVQKQVEKTDANYKANINNFLDNDRDVFDSEMQKAMWSARMIENIDEKDCYSGNAFEKIQEFKQYNQPSHPLMHQINEMYWDEIVDESKQLS
jgi:hypothetical protein